MIEIEVNLKNLAAFLNEIRKEDKEELKVLFGTNYKQEFIKTCLNNNCETYFLADNDQNPVAIGGVARFVNKNIKIGQVWLLCCETVYDNKLFLFKYIKDKVKNFKNKFDILFNYIYKSNFKALLWLSLLGFESVELKNKNFKFFYYKKEGVNFDIRRFTC